MGKASSSKKQARAARTGRGRTKRAGARGAWLLPGVMAGVVVLGTMGVVFSKGENSASAGERPRIAAAGRAGDHWHAAYAFYLCDKFTPPVSSQTDPVGIHTHGEGVIHSLP